MGMKNKAIVASAIMLIAASAFGFSRASLAKPYALTSAGKPIAKQCRTIMSGKHTRFAGGAADKQGCACIAKHATTNIPPKTLLVFTDIMSERLELANKAIKLNREDGDKRAQLLTAAQGAFKSIQHATKIPDHEFNNVMRKTSAYLKFCGKRANHSGDILKSIAHMTPYKKDEGRQPDTRQTSSLRPAYYISSQEDYTKLIAKSH
ncbi:MAG: hypothetical protein COA43_09275 [Robiginitomaculum sp.]|nr:MAG: hypothetical protein COA43_09275 [Robiginitomaculum sp.]